MQAIYLLDSIEMLLLNVTSDAKETGIKTVAKVDCRCVVCPYCVIYPAYVSLQYFKIHCKISAMT